MNYRVLWTTVVSLSFLTLTGGVPAGTDGNGRDSAPPAVGDPAGDFELKSLGGGTVKLSKMTGEGPVVLVILRGYPGYQCPVCSAQVGELLSRADDFRKAKAQVVLVYPGPSQNLHARAKEFIRDKTIPDHFILVVDPDLAFVRSYNLRWDAQRETAYPSTFVIDRGGKVRFATVSRSHGGRAKAADVLKALQDLR
jgi:peroxiredoxin